VPRIAHYRRKNRTVRIRALEVALNGYRRQGKRLQIHELCLVEIVNKNDRRGKILRFALVQLIPNDIGRHAENGLRRLEGACLQIGPR